MMKQIWYLVYENKKIVVASSILDLFRILYEGYG